METTDVCDVVEKNSRQSSGSRGSQHSIEYPLTDWQNEKMQRLFGNPNEIYAHFSKRRHGDIDLALYIILPVPAWHHKLSGDDCEEGWISDRQIMKSFTVGTLRQIERYAFGAQERALHRREIFIGER